LAERRPCEDPRAAERFGFNPKRRAGDLSRQRGKRAVAGALPGEAVIKHQHLIGSAPPFSNQPGSGFQFETSTPPNLCGLVELLRNVAKLALPLRAEAAESGFLHPVCDSSYQQLAAEMRGRIGFVERAPALTKLAEIELGEARECLPASRCILDRAAHVCCGAAMR